jgi:hypothetical protein
MLIADPVDALSLLASTSESNDWQSLPRPLVECIQGVILRPAQSLPRAPVPAVPLPWTPGRLAQGQMRTGPLIVGKIAVQRSPQRSLIPHDHVVQALASDRAHQSFRKGILPGESRCSKHFLHSHIAGHGSEVCSVDGISIPQHISACLIPGKRFPHLLHGPLLRGMFRHPEVHHSASLMRQQDKDEQDPEGRRWHGEKIDGHGLRHDDLSGRFASLSFEGLRPAKLHEGGLRDRDKYLATVDCATAMPNLSRSP